MDFEPRDHFMFNNVEYVYLEKSMPGLHLIVEERGLQPVLRDDKWMEKAEKIE
jgi:hypothetical protein